MAWFKVDDKLHSHKKVAKAGEGWWFHEWDERNPTAAEVEAKREAARERMREVRKNRKGHATDRSDDRGAA